MHYILQVNMPDVQKYKAKFEYNFLFIIKKAGTLSDVLCHKYKMNLNELF